jgi:hypothetical protein
MQTTGRIFSIVLTGMLTVLACSTKHNETVTQNDEWPEMDAFHLTMAEAFHPLKDSGNVEPAMRLMGQLADDADKWAASPLPGKVNNDDMKFKLEKLKNDIRVLSDEVKNGASEDRVGSAMHTLHDQFHEIMEAWHGADSEEGHVEERR